MILEILKDDHPILKQPCKPVQKIGTSLRKLLDDMLETMNHAQGVGLAAPQVGVSKRVIIVDVGEGLIELINPEILSCEGTDRAWEGCLSYPGIIGEIDRHLKLVVSGLDRQGHRRWVAAEGFLSRALQHEIDHLNGVVIKDRAIEIKDAPPPGDGEDELGEEPEDGPESAGERS